MPYAVALSISENALQQFVHSAFVNDLLPARYTGTSTQPGYLVTYDLTATEPIVSIADGDPKIAVKALLAGTLTFTSDSLPTITCTVEVKATIKLMPTLVFDAAAKIVQLGLDPTQAVGDDIAPFEAKVTAGVDPKPTYGFDLSAIKAGILLALIQSPPFLFTPPFLDEIARLGYAFKPLTDWTCTDKSFNVGVDVTGTQKVSGVDVPISTSGTLAELVDLNGISTAKGWRKTYSQALQGADDEFGEPLPTVGWTATTLRPPGPHNTDLAVRLSKWILEEYFHRVGRYEVVRLLEDAKFKSISNAITKLQGGNTYSLPQINRVFIRKLEADLLQGFLSVYGTVTYFTSVEVTTHFSFKLRLVRKYVDGSTDFVVAYDGLQGFTGEILDVDIDQPDWVSVIEMLGLVVGIILAPFTAATSLIVTMFFELILSSIVGSLLANAEGLVKQSIGQQMINESGEVPITLPGTTAPVLLVQANDIVVASDGVTAWFGLTTQAVAARIYVVGGPGYYQANFEWPVSNRDPISIRFDDGGTLYNPNDPLIRIRWQLFDSSFANMLINSDQLIAPSGPIQLDPKMIAIDHASDELTPFDTFLIKCRVYRPFGGTIVELFQQQMTVTIKDRLYREHRFVRWKHEVHYQDYSAKIGDPNRKPLGWKAEGRKSKIHYTDPDLRCKFADAYSQDLAKEDLDYFDGLPFPIDEIVHYRHVACVYCFLGGPDKTKLKPTSG